MNDELAEIFQQRDDYLSRRDTLSLPQITHPLVQRRISNSVTCFHLRICSSRAAAAASMPNHWRRSAQEARYEFNGNLPLRYDHPPYL